MKPMTPCFTSIHQSAGVKGVFQTESLKTNGILHIVDTVLVKALIAEGKLSLALQGKVQSNCQSYNSRHFIDVVE
jgi:hypothetical protein